MKGLGLRVSGSGFEVQCQCTRFRVSGFGDWESVSRIQGSRAGVEFSGLGIQGLGFWIQVLMVYNVNFKHTSHILF